MKLNKDKAMAHNVLQIGEEAVTRT